MKKLSFKKHEAVIIYEKEALSQVNSQLYEWLAIFNGNASNSSIDNPGESVNNLRRHGLSIPLSEFLCQFLQILIHTNI